MLKKNKAKAKEAPVKKKEVSAASKAAGAESISGVVFEGHKIRRDENGLWCLTDLWIAAGRPKNMDPRFWVRQKDVRRLIARASENVSENHVLRSSQGRNRGGTFAENKIALAYAAYLSADLHYWMLGVAEERIEEEADPELGIRRAYERAEERYVRRGHDRDWIQTRLRGIESRKHFTDTLQERGVKKGIEFGNCTNAIYRPLLGGTAKQVREAAGLSKNANLRDHLDRGNLAAIELAEDCASKRIEDSDSQGFKRCHADCKASAGIIAAAIKEASKAELSASP